MCAFAAVLLTLLLMTSDVQANELQLTQSTKASGADYCAWQKMKYPQYSMQLDWFEKQAPIELVIGSFLPSRMPWNFVAAVWLNESLKPVVDLALRDIRSHPCILKGYQLETNVKDTKCKASHGTKAFFDMMKTSPKKVAIFGDACTSVNEPVAMMTKYWKTIQVSYAETHPKFSGTDNQATYPTFFRMVPAELNLNNARYEFLKSFNWTRVGTIKQSDEPRYALPHETFTTNLPRRSGIKEIHTVEITLENLAIDQVLNKLKKNDSRIIIGDFSENIARKMFCGAYKRKLYGPNYVWVIPGYHNDTWWHSQGTPDKYAENSIFEEITMQNSADGCSPAELKTALNGHFIMEFVQERSEMNVNGINGMNVLQYLINYKKACDMRLKCRLKSNVWHGYVYDGIWTLAVALDQVVAEFWETFGTGRFRPETVNVTWFQNAFLQALNRTSFEGVTGKVRFESNQRLGKIRIAQFQYNGYVNVGEYDGAEDEEKGFQLYYQSLSGWKVPRDKRLEVRKRQYINALLYFVMCVLSVVGLILASVFLALNIRFRNHKFIRMSSPNMNNMIIIGSMLTYCSVIILGLDTRVVSIEGFTALCYVKVWVLCFGFTIAFGSLFSKTWRVHSIFTNIKLNKKAIKDYKLFLIVGVLLLMDAVILGCWAIVAPMSTEIFALEKDAQIKADDTVILPTIEICKSQHSIVFQGILYGYKGLLLVLGCFLAWETRHVNVPALNDSKYIGMAVYNVVLMCVLGVSLSFILATRKNEAFCLTSIFIIFCTTMTLCLVFLPKVVELVKNPKGNDKRKYRPGIMSSGMLGAGNQAKERKQTSDDEIAESGVDKLLKLEQDNQVWHQFLAERCTELADVIAELREYGDDFPSHFSNVKDSAFESTASANALVAAMNDPFGGVYIGPIQDSLVVQRKPSYVSVVFSSPTRSGVLSPKVEDATEETSLLPINTAEEKAAQSAKRHQFFDRLKSSLRGRTSSTDRPKLRIPHSISLDEPPWTQAKKLQRQQSVDSVTTMQNETAFSNSLPNLGTKLPLNIAGQLEFSDLPNAELSVKSDSTPTANSQGFVLKNEDHDEISTYDPYVPPGGGRLRYIDSILSDEMLLSNSRTLQSINEHTAVRRSTAALDPRERKRKQKKRSSRIPWPWLDPSLPSTEL